MILYLDIETLPTNDPAIIAEIEAGITAPANYSKPETIQKWMDENKAQAIKEKLAKTSFDGLLGRVACICWAFDDGPINSTLPNQPEANMLEMFYEDVASQSRIPFHGGETIKEMAVCGHNVAGFDLPFLKHRSIIHRVRPPAFMRKAMSAKPWGNEVADTMLMWSADREKRVSLDKLCRAFGIPGKDDFDGSMVAGTWPADPQKVIDYCKDDVDRVRNVYRRIAFI